MKCAFYCAIESDLHYRHDFGALVYGGESRNLKKSRFINL